MTALLALADGTIFAIGSVIFIAVFTAALGLASARFEELGEDDRQTAEADPPARGGPRRHVSGVDVDGRV
jgi:hypothetical protein